MPRAVSATVEWRRPRAGAGKNLSASVDHRPFLRGAVGGFLAGVAPPAGRAAALPKRRESDTIRAGCGPCPGGTVSLRPRETAEASLRTGHRYRHWSEKNQC